MKVGKQTRREWLIRAVAAGGVVGADARWSSRARSPLGWGELMAAEPSAGAEGVTDRTAGLILGGLLGDALGGPVEFGSGPAIEAVMPQTRAWPADRILDADSLQVLEKTLPLLPYDTLRPGTESYGQWRERRSAGTVTDDSRHKMVLLRMLRQALEENRFPVSERELAEAYLAFQPPAGGTAATAALCAEGFQEYRYAARWLLGERDLAVARPFARLWAGTNNCSGQMLLLPLAAVFPGDPESAYRAAFALDFVDGPEARDFAAALVAALAAVIDPHRDADTETARWELFFRTLRDVDPFGFAEVPFAGRPLHRWLERSEQFVARAAGSPAKLFRLLETEGAPVYWWDAHFTLLVPLTMIRFCQFQPLAALHLTLDFGHDTDSYAQVLGAMVGAVCGLRRFPAEMVTTMANAVRDEYHEDVLQWPVTLTALAKRQATGQRVVAEIG